MQSNIRKEVIDLGEQYNEHFDREMKLIARGVELDLTIDEDNYISNIIINHRHTKSIPKMFSKKEWLEAGKELYEMGENAEEKET